ncbi:MULTISPECIES: DinB family protein [Streptomyces]|uniref:DinB family protein n=1 Tax=Streptomyces TaxID=1883 RepID=UPI002248C30B|nr:DinB family protein [Streptomyces sp. JHD 1]MCX2968902.1 DinB family protein [Streptomyces sp. JHD 1]
MTTTTPHDPRPVPPPHADERTMLESWLDFHRETLALKCRGVTDAQARTASVEPSALTLLGLVQHLATVERQWFRAVLAGEDAPRLYEGEGEGYGFTLVEGRGLPEALADWRAQIAYARKACAARTLDDGGTVSDRAAEVLGASTVSLRWIYLHMIEEYARHNGHADLVRERVDGVTGS